MNTKADIWISAILYMGLGVIILTLVLTAGIPVINKIRDKNTAIDTENLMLSLDDKIRAVYSEGPGSRRPFRFDIRKGIFIINDATETITWTFETSALLSEPGIEIPKGNLVLITKETGTKNEYVSSFVLNYTNILDITLQSNSNEFTGANNLFVTNIGVQNSLPTVLISSV